MIELKELEQSLKESVAILVEYMVEDTSNKNPLMPKEEMQKKFQYEFINSMEIAKQQIYEGLHACLEAFELCHDLSIKKEEVISELRRSFDSLKTTKNVRQARKQLINGISWKALLGISEEYMESLYKAAKQLFDARKYDLAQKAFFVFCILEPRVSIYFVGLGHCQFHMGDYRKAIDSYAMVAMLDSNSSDPHIWAFNCFEKIKDKIMAKFALEEALKCEQVQAEPSKELIAFIQSRLKK